MYTVSLNSPCSGLDIDACYNESQQCTWRSETNNPIFQREASCVSLPGKANLKLDRKTAERYALENEPVYELYPAPLRQGINLGHRRRRRNQPMRRRRFFFNKNLEPRSTIISPSQSAGLFKSQSIQQSSRPSLTGESQQVEQLGKSRRSIIDINPDLDLSPLETLSPVPLSRSPSRGLDINGNNNNNDDDDLFLLQQLQQQQQSPPRLSQHLSQRLSQQLTEQSSRQSSPRQSQQQVEGLEQDENQNEDQDYTEPITPRGLATRLRAMRSLKNLEDEEEEEEDINELNIKPSFESEPMMMVTTEEQGEERPGQADEYYTEASSGSYTFEPPQQYRQLVIDTSDGDNNNNDNSDDNDEPMFLTLSPSFKKYSRGSSTNLKGEEEKKSSGPSLTGPSTIRPFSSGATTTPRSTTATAAVAPMTVAPSTVRPLMLPSPRRTGSPLRNFRDYIPPRELPARDLEDVKAWLYDNAQSDYKKCMSASSHGSKIKRDAARYSSEHSLRHKFPDDNIFTMPNQEVELCNAIQLLDYTREQENLKKQELAYDHLYKTSSPWIQKWLNKTR